MAKGRFIGIVFLITTLIQSGAVASSQSAVTDQIPPINLDGLFEFSDPDSCDWGKEVDHLVDKLWVYDGDDVPKFNRLDVPPQYRSAFGVPKVTTNADGSAVVFPLTGTIQKLKVTAFESFAPVGGDPPSLGLTFEGNEQIVRQNLQKLGIFVNENGHNIVDGDIYSHYTHIVSNDQLPTHTDLICYSG